MQRSNLASIESASATADGEGAHFTFKTGVGEVELILPESDLVLLMSMTSMVAGDLLAKRKEDPNLVNAFQTDWWEVRSAEGEESLIFTFRLVSVGIKMSFQVSRDAGPRIIETISHCLNPSQSLTSKHIAN